MGEAIKSRGSGAEPYRVGDIVLTANETLGEKWALCNGDPIGGGGISSELAEQLSANPLDDNAWQEFVFSNKYNKIVYDNINNIYYGILASGLTTRNIISIYKLNADTSEEEYIANYVYLYDSLDYGYYTISYLDSAFSVYKNKILLLLTYVNNTTGDYRYCLHEFDITSKTFTDVSGDPSLWKNRIEITGDYVTNEYYDYDNNEWISEDEYIYHPESFFITNDGFIIFLCYSPRYAIFIYSMDNMVYRQSYYLAYEKGNWEDNYGEYVRDELYTEQASISVAESANYIVIGIKYIDYSASWIELDEGYEPHYYTGSAAIIFNKTPPSYYLNIVNDIYSDYMETNNSDKDLYMKSVSCIDYDNDKFLFSTSILGNINTYVYEIDGKKGTAVQFAQTYSTNGPRRTFRTIIINGELCTLMFYNNDIYIRTGYDFSTILDISQYMLLNNVACNTYRSNCAIDEEWNQFNYSHRTLMFKADTGSNSYKYYGFVGQATLPLIDEEGMNAFIKIKN